jgi:hypothetical protein
VVKSPIPFSSFFAIIKYGITISGSLQGMLYMMRGGISLSAGLTGLSRWMAFVLFAQRKWLWGLLFRCTVHDRNKQLNIERPSQEHA